MKIREIMTKVALVVQEATPLERMIHLFSKHEITGAPVINKDGELIGVVSFSDLSRQGRKKDPHNHDFYLNASWGTVPSEEAPLPSETVADIMTHLVISAEADEDIDRAADLLVNHGIHRVVVTKDGHVVGMVSSNDLVREFRDRLKAERESAS